MISKILFPHAFKVWGWFILLIFIPLGIGTDFFDLQFSFLAFRIRWIPADPFTSSGTVNFTNTLVALALIVGLVLVAFSREIQEDEYVAHIRLESLLWAVIVNYILLALAVIVCYGGLFLDVMVYNLFTPLILFIARFNILIYIQKRQLLHAK
jgi:hypothetical protein